MRREKKKKGRFTRPFAERAELFFLQAEFFLQIVDVSPTILEVLVAHDTHLQFNVGFDTVDDQLLQGVFMRAIATSRFSPVADKLTDHGVIVRRYGVTGVNM